MISSKKGQGMPLSVIITGVIVVVVAIVLILTTTEFGKRIMGAGEAIPSALEAAAQGCKLAAENNLITDYCYNFREVGNSNYVNCEDDRVQSSLRQQDITPSITCDPGLKDNEIRSICADMTNAQRNDARFNGAKDTRNCVDPDFVGPPAA